MNLKQAVDMNAFELKGSSQRQEALTSSRGA